MKKILAILSILSSTIGSIFAQDCIGTGRATFSFVSASGSNCTYNISMSVTTTQNAAKAVRFSILNATPAVAPVCKINTATIINCATASGLTNIGNNVTITHTFTNVTFPCSTTPSINIEGTTDNSPNGTFLCNQITETTTNANPVKISYFKGLAINNEINLSWQTEAETNSNHFVVQRSHNAAEFNDLMLIKSAGESLVKTDYQYTDKNPLPGVNYYRLLQVDNDGSQTFSKIIDIKSAGGSSETMIFPNPSSGEFILQSNEEIISLELNSINGRKIDTKIQRQGGQYLLNLINKPGTGTYILQIKTTSGITKHRLSIND
ncbi:MAG: T9SS type A sorting domain-containing protein [Emticicia sp.]|uniref:T9SS type A sorting domain-containing protein n=1 Tax=Emticicia sp. TaxID=1930953 RepID=UPI003BA51F49